MNRPSLEKQPILLVTVEYTPYARLVEQDLVKLFSQYKVTICLSVRENQLGDDLHRLCDIYEQAGIPIVIWPLLPLKGGLFINKHTTQVAFDYLDVIFDWARSHGHRFGALLIDLEPSYVEPEPGEDRVVNFKNFRRVIKDMGKSSFQESIASFNRIIDKIHEHDCLAVTAAFPLVVEDKLKDRHAWEDFFGGPVATVNWDIIAFMMYTSWFVEFGRLLGMSWDASHYLAYEYSKDIKALWGDRALVVVGVANRGMGHEKVIYTSAAQIAPAVAAVKAAGIENIGIYDLKGILDSGEPESWFKMLRDTEPALPKKGRYKARRFRRVMRIGGRFLELFR